MIHHPLIRKFLARWHWLAPGLILGLFGAFHFANKAPKVDEPTVFLGDQSPTPPVDDPTSVLEETSETSKADETPVVREEVSPIPEIDEPAGVLEKEAPEDRQLLPGLKDALAKYERIFELLEEANAAEIGFQFVRSRVTPGDRRWITAKDTFDRTQDQALREFHRIRGADFDQEYWEAKRVEIEQVDDDRAARFGLANRLVRVRVASLQAQVKDR